MFLESGAARQHCLNQQTVVQEAPANSRTLQQVQGRMFELVTAISISGRMLHVTAPVTACRMAHFIYTSYGSQDLVHVRFHPDSRP